MHLSYPWFVLVRTCCCLGTMWLWPPSFLSCHPVAPDNKHIWPFMVGYSPAKYPNNYQLCWGVVLQTGALSFDRVIMTLTSILFLLENLCVMKNQRVRRLATLCKRSWPCEGAGFQLSCRYLMPAESSYHTSLVMLLKLHVLALRCDCSYIGDYSEL